MNKTGSEDIFYVKVSKTDMDEIESVGYYRWPFHSSFANLKRTGSRSTWRKILLLLIGVFLLPTAIIFPLYMKHKYFADLEYLVTDTDVLWIQDGISPYFCEARTLRTENTTFSAFHINTGADESTDEEKINYYRLTKNVAFSDDNLQYWRFSLTDKTTVNITVCSKYNEAKMAIFKGEKDFEACGLKNYAGRKDVKVGHQIPLLRYKRSDKSRMEYSSDESNFEKLLKICRKEDTLIHKLPPIPSKHCTAYNVQIFEHFVHEDDYYFYVFYSEKSNEIEISFDLSRPTSDYRENVEYCVNKSYCRFSLPFSWYLFSQNKVVIEMPMPIRNESEPDDDVQKLTTLVSTCEPRKDTYTIFMAVVLFLLILCACL